MTYEQWMKDTAATGRPRSKELKAVDDALLKYEKALASSSGSVLREKQALQRALQAWKDAQTAKGQDWRNSVRNKLKAVERLDAELGIVVVGAGGLNSRGELMIDADELRARKILADHIRKNTRTLFAGARLTVRNSKALADVNQVRSALGEFKNTAKDIKSAASGALQPDLRQKLHELLVHLFGNASSSEIESALGPTFGEFLTAVTPFLGAIKSGGQAIVKWGQAAKGLYTKSKMTDASMSFAPGDPAAAFDAVVRIQTREVHAYATSASIHTVSALAKTAFAAADFGALSGTLVGAAESLSLLVQKIYLFARDWNEMKDANELLDAGEYDLNLFKVCPLLGCYLIANSQTSDIINIAVGDYGRPGWKFEVEAMVKRAQPVFAKAREVILKSRYEIISMRHMKGTVVDRTATTLGIPTGRLSGAIRDISDKLDQAFV